MPFVASAALVLVGLYVRLRITETPAFQPRAGEQRTRATCRSPTCSAAMGMTLLLGTFAAVAVFVVFYLMTVFSLSWGTSAAGLHAQDFLVLQMGGMLFFGLAIPLSALAGRSHQSASPC